MGEWVTDNRKIGIGLTGFGVVFLVMGVLFFFDRTLLVMGNLLFLAGITQLIGIKRTTKFFLTADKLRGTICFLLGIIIVIAHWPMVGMILELFGIINLFGNFFPVILTFQRQIPGVGACLDARYVKPVVNKLFGESYLIGEN